MNIRSSLILFLAGLCLLVASCSGDNPDPADSGIVSSGKSATLLSDLPAAVIDAAHAARPELTISVAEYETRDGREYYDVGGTLPDGSELELDMTLMDGRWTVVEVQRDIAFAELPLVVGETLVTALPDWRAERIIESDQGDGTVIYEFFGAGTDGDIVKYEIKLSDSMAELLTDEWAH